MSSADVEAAVKVLSTKVADAGPDRTQAREANISGNRASTGFSYGYSWPWTWMNTIFGDPQNLVDKVGGQMMLSTLALVIMTILSGLFIFFMASIYTLLYGIIRASFHSMFSVTSETPLVIGLFTGLAYLACFSITRFVGQGYITTWDTLTSMVCGFVGHDRRRETTYGSYIANMIIGTVYIVMQLCGGLFGAWACDKFVKGSLILGAPVPDYSLVDRDGPLIWWNMIATGFFVLARLYYDNPSQLPHSKFGTLSSLVVLVVSIGGTYLGSTGAFDIMAPLCHAIIAEKWKSFWTLFVGQLIGAAAGLLLFGIMGLYHSIEQKAADKGYDRIFKARSQ
jgi:hypothetical protein